MLATLKEAGADLVATTLLETRQQLASLLPVLVQARGDERGPVGAARGQDGPCQWRAARDRGGTWRMAAGRLDP